jgi:hypothetical protein
MLFEVNQILCIRRFGFEGYDTDWIELRRPLDLVDTWNKTLSIDSSAMGDGSHAIYRCRLSVGCWYEHQDSGLKMDAKRILGIIVSRYGVLEGADSLCKIQVSYTALVARVGSIISARLWQ